MGSDRSVVRRSVSASSLMTVRDPGLSKKARCETISRIRVVVRTRPLSRKETENSKESILEVVERPSDANFSQLIVHEPKLKVDMTAYTEQHRFNFDMVYDEMSSNEELYRGTAAPLVSRIFSGQSATCFAYGATGAGKTHSMMGTETEEGLYMLAARDIFEKLRQPAHAHLRLFASSFEIYGVKVFDLLNQRSCLPVREDGRKRINVVGLTHQLVRDLQSFKALLILAADARKTAATLVHDTSSRSHAVLQLSIRSTRSAKDDEEMGRFSFIDLAGTERGADTLNCVDRDRRIEGAEINKSLLALKECIRGLDLGKAHVPFRGSKLTEVLRDSFIGDCHTVMIGALSPCIDSVEQTLNTLRYADRVRDFSAAPKLGHASVTDRATNSTCAPSLTHPSRQRSASAAVSQPSTRAPSKPPLSSITLDPPPYERTPPPPAGLPPSFHPSPPLSTSHLISSSPLGAVVGGQTSVRRESFSKTFNLEPTEMGGPDAATVEHVQRLLAEEKAERLMAEQLAQLKAPAEPPPPSAAPATNAAVGAVKPHGGRHAPSIPSMASTLPPVIALSLPPPPPATLGASRVSDVHPPVSHRLTRSKAAKEDNKENGQRSKPTPLASTARQAVFDAHRQFITSCVEQLEVHTYMLAQAENDPERDAALDDYVMGLEALLLERQASLGSLQTQLQAFRANLPL